ncbi:MAG: metal ABC transporter permease [Candidatus Omnitrophica bacterium]|nr:metal ABC transporter permease [Candidatus Omnitrophota bacterium]MCM8791496.1 metal ABC transporter permease [Candidatus Omnitrophota bacterium]
MIDIFGEQFMVTALVAGLIAGAVCAYLGVFVILKRIVFMGIALAEVAALGVALGLFAGLDPFSCAFVSTLTAVAIFWLAQTERSVSRESFIGFVYVFCAALAVILIAKNPMAEAMGVNLTSGSLLYTTWHDIEVLGASVIIIISVHLALFRKLIFVSFDKETAFTARIRADAIDLILYITIGVTISLATKICGVLFVFASLLIPAMVGLVVARRVRTIFIIACSASCLCVTAGLIFSYLWDLPTNPMIVVIYGVFFAIVLAVNYLRKR